MSSSGEEEEIKNDPEARIAFRRLRIQKRIEAATRAAMGEDLDEKKDLTEELSKSRKQIEESRQRLTKLGKDGFELVTNIRVAGDSREASRRTDEDEAKRLRKERLEQETKSGSEKFEEITKKWESALQKEVPQSLHDMLKHQKTSCDTMIEEKNKLINDFQQELKTKDDMYVKDLKKMAEDIDLMIERMEEQVKNLNKAYREELQEIERAFVSERNELLDDKKTTWEDQMMKRRNKEEEYMLAREASVEEYEQQLQHLRVHDAEEYNIVKIRLETDVQILEQQLQQMRATYQLNQEKLEYNFQVLKKRDDENTITKSQQKRKITRLQDVLNNLRIKLAKQEKQYRDENTQLTEDYKRITEQFHDLQRKSKHFMNTDAKKFSDVWIMNEDECKALVSEILSADRIIHGQQLGIEWESPDLTFLENIGPLMKDEGKARGLSASQIAQEVMSMGESDITPAGVPAHDPVEDAGSQGVDEVDEEKDTDKECEDEVQKAGIFSKISAQTIKLILELLCDESGFLVESKLNKLLQPLEKDERSLMKLDAIFTALGIETEDDIHTLSTYFMRFKEKQAAEEEKKDEGNEKPDEDQSAPVEQGYDELDEEVQQLTTKEEGEGEAVEPEKVELIHPNEVLKALRAFVFDHRKPSKEKGGKSQFKITRLEERDDSEDSDYWQKYASVLSEKKERVWDAMTAGLEKYYEVLTNRAKLITETDALTQQNAELRMLLHQYVNSKVNSELEIPPTRVLQMEMNP
ncbi:dynein regulatory complex protein 1-like [Gigantopelta aegis]|uniref:dynein regulatory complex protein 1-like n=1 Tax=Gigantopelta aegis TaxID=1735272 RepID=UPI001B88E3B1|nr:dynein regulatory complex protein 1-like [Gigantopelta aegis]